MISVSKLKILNMPFLNMHMLSALVIFWPRRNIAGKRGPITCRRVSVPFPQKPLTPPPPPTSHLSSPTPPPPPPHHDSSILFRSVSFQLFACCKKVRQRRWPNSTNSNFKKRASFAYSAGMFTANSKSSEASEKHFRVASAAETSLKRVWKDQRRRRTLRKCEQSR